MAAGAAWATGGAIGAEGLAAALAGAIGRTAAVLGRRRADAPGLELTTGGGEVRHTHSLKE